jgi:hypothetical protein
MRSTLPAVAPLVICSLFFLAAGARAADDAAANKGLVDELAARWGEAQRPAIERGVRQVAELWRREDGDAAAMADFVRANYAGTPAERDALFDRMEFVLESIAGHTNEMARDMRRQSDLEIGPIYRFDEVMAGYDPGAHVLDDFFANKLAFTVLLNFPLTALEERLAQGPHWSRRQWAEARLAQRFGKRIPAEVNLAIADAAGKSAQYIADYNVWMHHLVDEKGGRLFPPKMRLLSHWNLRDELKADYADKEHGLARQRMIARVMERIVTQTIPAAVVDNPGLDWNPVANTVAPAGESDADASAVKSRNASADREPDTRYAMLLSTFQAARKADPYSPTAPTLIARRFEEDRELPEPRVKKMLEDVVSSPLVLQTAKLIEKRLGRKLEPFDVWYNGFRAQPTVSAEELDRIVKTRYPTAEAYKKDIPNLLVHLGFSPEKAAWVAANIEVDPARGSGHALGAGRRADHAHLRTRVEKDGMNYKGFNIAVHEMGHNVEQTFSLNAVDHTLLSGVPNTAFTEALAFVFQAHDLELLGVARPDAKARAMKTLDDFWGCYEISGVALVDMAVWHWMYDHPNATAAQLREATVSIAKDVWNRYYAPVFGEKDVLLLGIYSHMIDSFLYLPDYPIGHMIAFQINRQIEKAGNLGAEFERMATFGSVTPDLWMEHATGQPVGPGALLEATKAALEEVR